jgi:hypothetical protein
LDTVESLVLDLLEWIGPSPRPYAEVQEAWRTSCPRLPVWEDAVDGGLVDTRFEPGRGLLAGVTPLGEARLAASGRASARLPRARA